VKVTQLVVSLVVTTGTAATAVVAVDVPGITTMVRTVAGQATCRTVNIAILAYTAEHDVAPLTLADIRPYAYGDISAFRIVDGVAAGPGCPTPPAHP
jgi:hypothetical protein